MLALGTCPCIYYGHLDQTIVEQMAHCDLIVLSPLANPTLVSELSQDRIVLGYVSIATVGGWEPWASRVTPDLVVGVNPTWNERIVDACSEEWRQILLDAVKWVLDRGFNGVFLDNLDVVDRYPWMKECIASLVKEVRREYPNAIIMVNRGFSILRDIAPFIDYLLVESFPSYYDFQAKTYRIHCFDDLEWIVSKLREAEKLSMEYGFRIVILAYGEPRNSSLVKRICNILDKYARGIPVYLATWDLQQLGVCDPCAAPHKALVARATPTTKLSASATSIKTSTISVAAQEPGPAVESTTRYDTHTVTEGYGHSITAILVSMSLVIGGLLAGIIATAYFTRAKR
ncbi:TM1410 hypothetical-related protein [Pyrolobus fumarii 1A]|uniref:TM1410 hypothetical-related protein n=1 Tax=Pyrolobus fumarii (strain DSM 11204 / 1A) TaxID=694429 RepID=G0ECP2_PYRF1|nr:endo alpha-1,4 polygalactosaminidase [Pyrolobus fumarii]AEM39612.1 TM1410 hypothetical-related protein [Pyrolobus fumarii 1A]